MARQTGDAQGESDGSMTPAVSISATRSSSAVPEGRGGRRGDCRIEAASALSMSCSRRLQNPMSVGDLAKTSLRVMRRFLKFEARVGDNLASWSVVRNRTRRCSSTSESAALGPEGGASGRTDVGRNEGSSKQGVRGATAGCRDASEGSCAAEADGGVVGSSVAGTEGGEGDEGSSPGSDEVITATSLAGGEMGSK